MEGYSCCEEGRVGRSASGRKAGAEGAKTSLEGGAVASVAAPRGRLRERPRWDERKQRRRSSRSQPAIALSPTTTIPPSTASSSQPSDASLGLRCLILSPRPQAKASKSVLHLLALPFTAPLTPSSTADSPDSSSYATYRSFTPLFAPC